MTVEELTAEDAEKAVGEREKSVGEPAFCTRHSCESRNLGIAREGGH